MVAIQSCTETASITNKSENQDAALSICNDYFKAIIVADGLGSFTQAKLAAQATVEFMKSTLENSFAKQANFTVATLSKMFSAAKENLIYIAREKPGSVSTGGQNLFATTAIVLLELEDRFVLAYTGNGGIWHIRANFDQFPTTFHFPWNAINYLNPHTIPQQGKEALHRFISDSDDFTECVPTIIEIEKDREYGDVFMVCTDGIYSADQLKTGSNDKGIWVRYEQTMILFFNHLNALLTSTSSVDRAILQSALEKYLQEILPSLDDDATIGLLISKEALAYHTTRARQDGS